MNFWSNYDPQTGRGEEPWWSYAKSLDLADVGKLPAYAYSKLPLPGSELASGIAGGWEQPEYPRGSYNNPQTGAFDPSRYIPRTTAERQTRIPSAEEQNVRPYERFPQLDVAMAAMPLARPAANLGRQAGRQFAYDMFESPIAEAGAIRPRGKLEGYFSKWLDANKIPGTEDVSLWHGGKIPQTNAGGLGIDPTRQADAGRGFFMGNKADAMAYGLGHGEDALAHEFRIPADVLRELDVLVGEPNRGLPPGISDIAVALGPSGDVNFLSAQSKRMADLLNKYFSGAETIDMDLIRR